MLNKRTHIIEKHAAAFYSFFFAFCDPTSHCHVFQKRAIFFGNWIVQREGFICCFFFHLFLRCNNRKTSLPKKEEKIKREKLVKGESKSGLHLPHHFPFIVSTFLYQKEVVSKCPPLLE